MSRIIRCSSSSIEKLKELRPQDDLKAADSRLYRHKLYYFGLYYIICFPVKENLWIMRGYTFLMWLCLRLITDHLNDEQSTPKWDSFRQLFRPRANAPSRPQRTRRTVPFSCVGAYNCPTTRRPVIYQFFKNTHLISVLIAFCYKK